MREFTIDLSPSQFGHTHYGYISNADWLERERERLGKDNFFIRNKPDGLMCLVTNLKKLGDEHDSYAHRYRVI